jgi:anti-sigma factor RsiW
MKNQINSRDYELISAYLDNQLSSKDHAFFEERLKADPELQKELNEISDTRLILRSLPQRRAPRNYYVTVEAVRPRSNLKLAPIFGIVSAAASVLLALVIFGSSFLRPTYQTAMAPAPVVASATITSQQEIARSAAASPLPPTSAPPAVLLEAPIQVTSTPFIPELSASLPEIATPTTIYIYAYPPPSTTGNAFSIAEAPTTTVTISCDEYFELVPLPSSADIYNCPTPTGTLSKFLESILSTSTATPTFSPTVTLSPTSTLTLTPTSTETPSPTLTPTPTATPSPTETPTPTATPMPAILQAPQAQKNIPSGGAESITESTTPNLQESVGGSTEAAQAPTQAPSAASDYSFLNYLLLTVELSLAVIAVLAGITAIILRIRAR